MNFIAVVFESTKIVHDIVRIISGYDIRETVDIIMKEYIRYRLGQDSLDSLNMIVTVEQALPRFEKAIEFILSTDQPTIWTKTPSKTILNKYVFKANNTLLYDHFKSTREVVPPVSSLMNTDFDGCTWDDVNDSCHTVLGAFDDTWTEFLYSLSEKIGYGDRYRTFSIMIPLLYKIQKKFDDRCVLFENDLDTEHSYFESFVIFALTGKWTSPKEQVRSRSGSRSRSRSRSRSKSRSRSRSKSRSKIDNRIKLDMPLYHSQAAITVDMDYPYDENNKDSSWTSLSDSEKLKYLDNELDTYWKK